MATESTEEHGKDFQDGVNKPATSFRRMPESSKSTNWTPAFAGVTAYSDIPLLIVVATPLNPCCLG
jgi:hypothetical protein